MKELFNDILSLDDVNGIMLFSFEGKLIFKEFLTPLPEEPECRDWWRIFIYSLNGAREVDLIFEKSRLYVRKTDLGYLMILMGVYAPTAMMRLNCDLLLPSLKQIKTTKGLGRLFRMKT
jgi:hypothetical protein